MKRNFKYEFDGNFHLFKIFDDIEVERKEKFKRYISLYGYSNVEQMTQIRHGDCLIEIVLPKYVYDLNVYYKIYNFKL